MGALEREESVEALRLQGVRRGAGVGEGRPRAVLRRSARDATGSRFRRTPTRRAGRRSGACGSVTSATAIDAETGCVGHDPRVAPGGGVERGEMRPAALGALHRERRGRPGRVARRAACARGACSPCTGCRAAPSGSGSRSADVEDGASVDATVPRRRRRTGARAARRRVGTRSPTAPRASRPASGDVDDGGDEEAARPQAAPTLDAKLREANATERAGRAAQERVHDTSGGSVGCSAGGSSASRAAAGISYVTCSTHAPASTSGSVVEAVHTRGAARRARRRRPFRRACQRPVRKCGMTSAANRRRLSSTCVLRDRLDRVQDEVERVDADRLPALDRLGRCARDRRWRCLRGCRGRRRACRASAPGAGASAPSDW